MHNYPIKINTLNFIRYYLKKNKIIKNKKNKLGKDINQINISSITGNII